MHIDFIHPAQYGFPGICSALRRLDPFQQPKYWHRNRDLERIGHKELQKRIEEFRNEQIRHQEA